MKTYKKRCAGPGKEPYSQDCNHGDKGVHELPLTGKTAPFNVDKDWRCPKCRELKGTQG